MYLIRSKKRVKLLVAFFLTVVALVATTVSAEGYIPLEPLTTSAESGVTLSSYLDDIFKIGIGLAGVFAVLMIVIGGIGYIGGASNPSARSEAKGKITSAILGLILATASWLILYTINPNLLKTELTISAVGTAQQIGIEEQQQYVESIVSDELRLMQNIKNIDSELVELGSLQSLTPEQEATKASLLAQREETTLELEEVLGTKEALIEEKKEEIRCLQQYEPTNTWCSGDGYIVDDSYCSSGRICCAYRDEGCDNTPPSQ